MPYFTTYLRTATKAQMKAALIAANVVREVTDPDTGAVKLVPHPSIVDFHVLGAIVTAQPVIAADGTIITPAVVDTRFHVNIRTTVQPPQGILDQLPVIATPLTPSHSWAS